MNEHEKNGSASGAANVIRTCVDMRQGRDVYDMSSALSDDRCMATYNRRPCDQTPLSHRAAVSQEDQMAE